MTHGVLLWLHLPGFACTFCIGLTSQGVHSMVELQLLEILTFVTTRHVRLSLWVPEVPSVLPYDPEDMNEETSDRTDTESYRDRLLCVECHLKHQFQKPFPGWTTYRFQQARHRLILTGHSFSLTNLARLGAVCRTWLRATLSLTSDPVRPKINDPDTALDRCIATTQACVRPCQGHGRHVVRTFQYLLLPVVSLDYLV